MHEAAGWLSHNGLQNRKAFLHLYSRAEDEAVYVLTFTAPPGMVKRTLSALAVSLGCEESTMPLLIPVGGPDLARRRQPLFSRPEPVLAEEAWREAVSAVNRAKGQR